MRPVSAANPTYSFSVDGGANTFLTGGGLPNKDKHDSDSDDMPPPK